MNQIDFESEFSSRTLAFHPEFRDDDRPIVVVLDNSAQSPVGHALLVSLANQLARAHRRLVFVGDFEQPLLCADHFALGALGDACAGLATRINPFMRADLQPSRPSAEALLTIGIGTVGCDLNIGCDGWVAHFDPGARVDPSATSFLGAFLASVMAASTAFHRLRGDPQLPTGDYSLWAYGARSDAQGPTFGGPLDVGDALQVGAGAVGSALDYWAYFHGLIGRWCVADGDGVDVSNLNRQLMFLASDAGFPNGVCSNKADLVAERLGSPFVPSPHWYGDDSDVVAGRYDVVLPLANERGVRALLQARAQTVLLHGTTSSNWQAQAHRHVAGRDGCVTCRMPTTDPTFVCATGKVGRIVRADASLPFLSAMAGLLLFSDLIRLQSGNLLDANANYRAIEMSSPLPSAQASELRCEGVCRSWMAPPQRLARTQGARFAALDGARA